MPPRTRAAPSDAFHGSFDPGVTGRRTGIAPPSKVRRTSNGIEAFSDYWASPRKDPSLSPEKNSTSSNHSNTPIKLSSSKNKNLQNNQSKRIRNDRPDLYHEIGERGRKTGVSPPLNALRDENGFEQFDTYLIKATEQTNKEILRERRKSLRKSLSAANKQFGRKLSVATFVDNGDEDDDNPEFLDESMSLVTRELDLSHAPSVRFQAQQSHQSNQKSSKSKNPKSNSKSLDHSIRTPTDSELIDFDTVPELSKKQRTQQRSPDQPMTVRDEEEETNDDDDQGHESIVPNQDNVSVASDPSNSQPEPINLNHNQDQDVSVGLDDILEEDEDGSDPVASQNDSKSKSIKLAQASNRWPSNRHPPYAGVRRGQRRRVEPLAYWKGERIVYGRSVTPDGSQRVIGMIDVVRVPRPPPKPFAQLRHRRGQSRVKSESIQPSVIQPPPEEGWDSKTSPNGVVYSHTKQRDCERAIVCTKHMLNVNVEDQAGIHDSFQFIRVCKDADYVAGGLMYIPVGGGKPLKPAKDNFYIFTVLEGAVSVNIHRTTFAVAPHGMFWVPRGNVYAIQNISKRTAKLAFAQARRTTGSEPELESDEDEEKIIATDEDEENKE
ncbi:hypothetical protein O181_071267 [Austropuccinia psidii MF-1]|uniref:Mif2/CENP-C cupin domain-containing protein n=1 Tax=Austropuccinia psidii MF-1 TaxID=1389203 RepID=A0A9Q3I912_9BASI|nr:hypothetical protein [Austropuccinia psidii MF-1]